MTTRRSILHLGTAALLSVCLLSCENKPTNEVVGYWHWTYADSTAPPGTTLSLAFFGSVNTETALKQSLKVKDKLKGNKFLCLGGGNDSGKFTEEAIEKIISAIQAGDFDGYQGLAFDVELGASHLEKEFEELFAATQAQNMKVLVTVSHSDPFGVGDKSTLMKSFFASDNIDYLSPQLYTSGKETANDYDAVGIQFSDYANSNAKVVPSIVRAEHYEDAVAYFNEQGVNLAGYIQWHQHSP